MRLLCTQNCLLHYFPFLFHIDDFDKIRWRTSPDAVYHVKKKKKFLELFNNFVEAYNRNTTYPYVNIMVYKNPSFSVCKNVKVH